MRERSHLDEIGIDVRIILKLFFERNNVAGNLIVD
jgi:hypothetical protein